MSITDSQGDTVAAAVTEELWSAHLVLLPVDLGLVDVPLGATQKAQQGRVIAADLLVAKWLGRILNEQKKKKEKIKAETDKTVRQDKQYDKTRWTDKTDRQDRQDRQDKGRQTRQTRQDKTKEDYSELKDRFDDEQQRIEEEEPTTVKKQKKKKKKK